MKIILLIDSKAYSYTKRMAEDFVMALEYDQDSKVKREINKEIENGTEYEIECEIKNEVEVVDMSCGKPEHEIYYYLRDIVNQYSNDEVTIITLDCAGFNLTNELDGLSLNNLSCRMAHVLLQSPDRFRQELSKQMNFSMFVYARENSNVPNVGIISGVDYTATDDKSRSENRQSIREWFSKYCEDSMLTVE